MNDRMRDIAAQAELGFELGQGEELALDAIVV